MLLICLMVMAGLSDVQAGKKTKVKKAKQKRTKAEWEEALKRAEREEMEEWEEERRQKEEEIQKYHGIDMSDPKKWIEQMGGGDNAADMLAGMGGGSMAGPSMSFVHLSKDMTKPECEELVVQWRDLLMTAGYDVVPYMVDDHLALMKLDEKWKVMDLKDFVLDPYAEILPLRRLSLRHYSEPAIVCADISHKAKWSPLS